jgi:predicted metal-dependent peptidase
VGRIVAAVDTSASFDDVLLGHASAALGTLADTVRPSVIDVVYCDYSIQSTESFEREDPVVLHPQGGGGTRFKPVFEHVNAQEDPPAVLIYFTDLEGPLDELETPDYPVVWCVINGTGRESVPFGEVLAIQ